MTGSPDCSTPTRSHQDLAAAPPAGWRCEIGARFKPHEAIQYYTDQDGHYGFWFDWSDYPEPVVGMGRAVLKSSNGLDIVDFGPTTTGFVRFPGTYQNGTVDIVTYGFTAHGSPDFLSTSALSMLQLDNRDGMVYVWHFTAPDGSIYQFSNVVYHPTDADGFHWAPGNVYYKGADYNVTTRVYRGIATGHNFDFRTQDPLAMIRKPQGC